MPYPPLNVEQGATTLSIVVAIGGTVLGAALWAAGARFSRGLVTLTAVALGAIIGRELPRWFGWSINPMGPTVGGALVIGLTAFILHRVWLGLVLACLLGGWAAGSVCLTTVPSDSWIWPTVNCESTVDSVSQDLWNALPPRTQRIVPFAAGLGLISGLAFMLRWPRLATALSYSVLGASLLIIMGLSAIQLLRPGWRAWLPQSPGVQIASAIAFVLVGTLIQWIILPAPRKAPAPPKPEEDAAPAE